MDVAEEVGLDHLPEDIGRRILELGEECHRGVVDPDVDPPEGLDRPPGQRLNRRLIPHIRRHCQRPRS